MPRAKDQPYSRPHVLTVRLNEYLYQQLPYAAALQFRTKSSLMEWLLAKHIEENIEKIQALRKIKEE